MPSKPTTDRSRGTSSPRANASCIAPIAIRSLEQITAVGRSPFEASRSARSALRPPATLQAPCAGTEPRAAERTRTPGSLLAVRARVRLARDEADPLVPELDQVLGR